MMRLYLGAIRSVTGAAKTEVVSRRAMRSSALRRQSTSDLGCVGCAERVGCGVAAGGVMIG